MKITVYIALAVIISKCIHSSNETIRKNITSTENITSTNRILGYFRRLFRRKRKEDKNKQMPSLKNIKELKISNIDYSIVFIAIQAIYKQYKSDILSISGLEISTSTTNDVSMNEKIDVNEIRQIEPRIDKIRVKHSKNKSAHFKLFLVGTPRIPYAPVIYNLEFVKYFPNLVNLDIVYNDEVESLIQRSSYTEIGTLFRHARIERIFLVDKLAKINISSNELSHSFPRLKSLSIQRATVSSNCTHEQRVSHPLERLSLSKIGLSTISIDCTNDYPNLINIYITECYLLQSIELANVHREGLQKAPRIFISCINCKVLDTIIIPSKTLKQYIESLWNRVPFRRHSQEKKTSSYAIDTLYVMNCSNLNTFTIKNKEYIKNIFLADRIG
ncbi:hypothetical protein NEOKW01_0247 [Nematocida sp. AWRm80]|nr:hypothetical protein NEOKW01_0247 [Nematocida sp. AWRm80]